jgi:serralysin
LKVSDFLTNARHVAQFGAVNGRVLALVLWLKQVLGESVAFGTKVEMSGMINALQQDIFWFLNQGKSQQVKSAGKPHGSIGDFVRQLTVDSAHYFGDPANASFDLRPGRALTFNVSNLSKAGKWFAKKALAAWTATTGIEFREVNKTSKADIVFVQNDNSGAYATTKFNGKGDITKAKVNIPPSWYRGEEYKLDSYGYQTFLHEIGHALGLGHAGNYNGSGSFAGDARFSNDSWQMSIMSYFSQTENPNVKGSFAYTLTPMPADIAAVHKLYGEPSGGKQVNDGNTVWGFGSNAKGPAKQFTKTKGVMAMTIFDQGGEDVMNFSKTGKKQKIDLNPGAFSNVLGKAYNVQIERGTWIENAKTGGGKDKLYGNVRGNDLFGGDKADKLFGRAGSDNLYGQLGNDYIRGGDGADSLFGAKGADELFGNDGNDVLKGGAGADKLAGNAGNDRLDGGDGNDIMIGGADADIFVFNAGHDKITDFDNTEGDTIEINGSLVATTDVAQFLTDNAAIVNGDVVITFDNGATLTVEGVSNTLDLVDDISFI